MIFMERGKFIVFEGTDGSGKSTQAKMLFKYLAERGIPAYFTCEPTDSFVGALLRSALGGRVECDEHTIAALFAADRLDHIQNSVNGLEKKLSEGTYVVCDRYYFSSYAYNGGQVDPEWVVSLNAPARKMLKADLTIFLDLPPEECMARISRRGEQDRYETLEKQRKIREKYLEMFARFPDEKVRVIKSGEDKTRTQSLVRKAVEEELGI